MIYTFDLKNKVALVTGGYGHLGKAITESLVFHGAKVYVLGRDENKFLESFKENKNLNHSLYFQSCDVSDSKNIKAAFETIYSINQKIDILINNAVYSKGQSPENMTDDDWATGVDGTLGSVFKSIREIIPYFKSQKSGKIINVSSMYGMVAPQFEIYNDHPGFLNPPHYGAAKAGVIQLTKYYASYLGADGVTVNTVTPGPFPSQAVQVNEGFVDELKKKTCLNKIGKPEDLAGVFVFLSSDAANFITGQNFVIDGGWTIK